MILSHEVHPTNPNAVFLLEMLQSEYVGLYGEPDPNPEGGLDDAYERNGGVIVLSDSKERKPLAVGGWTHLENGVACLRRMYVHYGYRKLGLSKRLLKEIEDSARRRGMVRMVLETGTVQLTAIHLYSSAGYSATEPFGFYKDSPESVFMGRDL